MKKLFVFLSLMYLLSLSLLTIFFPWLGWGMGLEQNVDQILLAPGAGHWFGTDSLGRDIFARILLGGRVSLTVGLVCSFFTFILGFSYGAIAGWFEGALDSFLMRLCDILIAVPSFILVSVFCLSLQLLLPIEDVHSKALITLCVGISVTHWMSLARVTRGLVLEIKRKPYIEAAVALGGTRTHIIIRHMLPNMMGTLIVLIGMQIPISILYESFMSFIGLGIHPPYTSWGILVREGWKTLSTFPHLILFPSLTLFLTIWSAHVLLDAFKGKWQS